MTDHYCVVIRIQKVYAQDFETVSEYILVVNTDYKTVEEIAEEIVVKLTRGDN